MNGRPKRRSTSRLVVLVGGPLSGRRVRHEMRHSLLLVRGADGSTHRYVKRQRPGPGGLVVFSYRGAA